MNSTDMQGVLVILTIFILNKVTAEQLHEVILERVEILYVDTTVGEVNGSVNRISRKDFAVTVYMNFFQDELDKASEIIIQGYSYHNNEYRLAPLMVRRNICSFLETEWNLIKSSFQKFGKVPQQCPVHKGLYYVKNYILDSSRLPEIPWERLMLYVNLTYKGKLSGSAKVYIRFNHDAKLVNKFLKESGM